MENSAKNSKLKTLFSLFLPLILLALLLVIFLNYGPLGVFKAAFPPVEEAFIQRVILEPETLIVEVMNDGPEQITIAQVLINDAYWAFEMEPQNTLNPLEQGTIHINYPWLEGDTEHITLITKNGVTFDTEVPVATLTPKFNFTFFKTFVLLGIYVGVIPVLLGLLWFPFLRKLQGNWYSFLLALTVGLLVFLGFDTLEESFELTSQVPNSFNGIGLLVIGFLLAIFVLSYVSYKTEHHSEVKGPHYKALVWGYLIALGIGLHNLGEGLAIGSAYAIGEIALGATLVIGFMVHNITEGIAIVSPLTRAFSRINHFILHLILMGIIAGGPTIIGTLIGGFAFSPTFAVLFLAIGAGAIFDVSLDILQSMKGKSWDSLFNLHNVSGFIAGLLIMYVTGFLVLG